MPSTVENNPPDSRIEPVPVDDREVGPGLPPFIIAEVAQAHDGSLGTAHAYVDAVADAGAHAIKFQTHIAAEESTFDEPFRVRFSRQDETRYGYWTRMEFTPEQWKDLAEHARTRGLTFLSSPFSVAAVEMLWDLGVRAWKIGSGEFGSRGLLEAMGKRGGTILLSTGMSRMEEIAQGVEIVRSMGMGLVLFQCTSRYPTPLESVGIHVIDELRERFHCPVGLSDHSGSVFPGLKAMALGADLLEVHVTMDRRLFGPDVKASVTVDELAFLAEAGEAFFTMETNPVDKDRAAEELQEMRRMFSKSVAPRQALPVGTVLTRDMLTLKKPGTGIPEHDMDRLVGRVLKRAVPADRLLSWEDVE